MRTRAEIAIEWEAHAADKARFLERHQTYVAATPAETEAHAEDLRRFIERHDVRSTELTEEAKHATE